jgi:hypothetical protein
MDADGKNTTRLTSHKQGFFVPARRTARHCVLPTALARAS